MKVEILYQSMSAVAKVILNNGEGIQAEVGSMVGMSPQLHMETDAEGGVLKSLSRRLFGGESFFLNTYTATQDNEFVMLAPPVPGDILAIEMQDQTYLVQAGAYMASSAEIEVNTQWEGAKSFFAGEGLVMLEVKGTGTLIVSSFGAIHPIELEAGEAIVLDTCHLVVMDPYVQYRIKTVAGLESTLFSGEGLVVELTGPGHLYMQTRVTTSFLAALLEAKPDMLLKVISRD